ncbi:MAG: hypothetical protein RR147_06740 [Oscillospiraceae bacterium]
MGEKTMKKDVKKKKKTDISSAATAPIKTVVAQPERISKKKKDM